MPATKVERDYVIQEFDLKDLAARKNGRPKKSNQQRIISEFSL
jgi:hypothetical protein